MPEKFPVTDLHNLRTQDRVTVVDKANNTTLTGQVGGVNNRDVVIYAEDGESIHRLDIRTTNYRIAQQNVVVEIERG